MNSDRLPLSSCVVIDDQRDLLTVHGIRFAGDLFRHLAVPTPPGRALRIIKAEDGVVTVRQFETEHPDAQ